MFPSLEKPGLNSMLDELESSSSDVGDESSSSYPVSSLAGLRLSVESSPLLYPEEVFSGIITSFLPD